MRAVDFGKSLLMKQAFTSCSSVSFSMIMGDLFCQQIVGDPLEWHRAFRMGATGFLVAGPVSFSLHQIYERIAPGNAMRQIAKKLALTLFVTAPVHISATLTAATMLTPGKNAADAQEKVASETIPTIINSIPYWGTVHALNYRYTPVHNRPVLSSVAGVFWNIYFSWQANKSGKENTWEPVMYSKANCSQN
mmetsp:Transcript_1297/g.2164  ORF Transcript_1297/g.2164 Transcript_1297/m.2164 type:complete len:192 (+) Transcript_1297:167-742(+)